MFGYWRSSASWRVRLFLAHKGIKYEYIPTNLIKNEQKTDEFAKLNPSKVSKQSNIIHIVSLCQHLSWKKETLKLCFRKVFLFVNTLKKFTPTCQRLCLMIPSNVGKSGDFVNKSTLVLSQSKTWWSLMRLAVDSVMIKRRLGPSGPSIEGSQHLKLYLPTQGGNIVLEMK